MRLAILFTLLVSSPALAGEMEVCSAYLKIQNHLKCDPDGYIIRTGYTLCRKFVEANHQFTPAGRKAMAEIRRCLANSLLKMEPALSCENAEELAYSSHVECYVTAGFCELPFSDKLTTIVHLHSIYLNPLAWDQFFRLNDACAARD